MTDDVTTGGTQPYEVEDSLPQLILSEVADYFDTSTDDLRAPRPSMPFTEAQQVGIYLIRELSDLSFAGIARIFGTDHQLLAETHRAVIAALLEKRDLYWWTQDLAQRIQTRAAKHSLVATYNDLGDGLAQLGHRLESLASLSEPHARALVNDLSSLEHIKLELQSLLAVVERLLHARDLANQVTEASARLATRKRIPHYEA